MIRRVWKQLKKLLDDSSQRLITLKKMILYDENFFIMLLSFSFSSLYLGGD